MIWNFDRVMFLNRFIKQRYSVSFPYHSILCGNIRSIRNKLDEVKETVLVHNCNNNIFTESWLNSFCKDNITSINGYNQFRLDREQKHALFHNTMNNIDFAEETVIIDGLSLQLRFATLPATLTSAYDYCFPPRKIKIYNNIPWITNSIRQMMKSRDNACRRGNAAVFEHYRKKVKEAILRAKAKYCASINNLSSKSEWKKVKSILNLEKRHTSTTDVSADSILSFFTSIKSHENSILFNDLLQAPDDKMIITYNEVLNAMNLCKKGGGVPFVPSWIIREYQDILAEPLRVIFQASIDMGIIPKSMKVAKITPIPKVKNPTCVSDYRPITCTSPFSKILERIVHTSDYK